ncbi:DUF6087 family protein [Actinacidiphila glaucinigra]|uniref:DUF6087 family protein n=1 Tax=Actinacidiphila glaucinigra TaxID=235986 RepID=UPI002DD93BD6|nr:DUF6087 family protein [Actinacidiphila glaucinigra]WSD60867.1 DUF6087 family protein [Actinacidiphila glaucinigra]
MEDEPLEQWLRRRNERQARKTGRLRAGTLAPGPPRGAHVAPDAPRLISRWDGHAWQPVAVVADLAEARAVLRAARNGRRAASPTGGNGAATPPPAAAADRREARLRALLDE